MRITSNCAAIDADFLIHVSQINKAPEDIARILNIVICGMNLSAIIHPLVYEKEVKETKNASIDAIILNQIVFCVSLEDIFKSDETKSLIMNI